MRQIPVTNLESKLARDYPLQEELPKGAVQEWCREALSKIDSYDQWEKKSLVVTIKSYRTPIPADFYAFNLESNTYEAREQGTDLYFDIEEGTIVINYLAFPTDKQGVILIPDTEDFKDALAYYCVANMCRKRIILSDREMNYETYHQKFLDKKFEARADLYLRDHVAKDHMAQDFHNIQRGLDQSRSRYGRK